MIVTGERAIPLPGSTGGSELAFLIRGERAPTVGFYFLLFMYQLVRNQTENAQNLEMRLQDVKAMLREGKATSLDVTQVQASLETARTRRTFRERFFGDQLDRFKLQLGLPPDLELEIDDSLLEPFELRSDQLAELEDRLRKLDAEFDLASEQPRQEPMKTTVRRLKAIHEELELPYQLAEKRLKQLQQSLPKRTRDMTPDEAEAFRSTVQQDATRLKNLQTAYQRQGESIPELEKKLQQAVIPEDHLRPILTTLIRQRDTLSRGTRRLNGLETVIRVELIELKPVPLTPAQGVQLALENRLDLMNRRALVMDARRRLEIAADRLEANVDVVAEGEVNTKPLLFNQNAYDFRAKESSYRVGVAVTPPLDRRRERNNFRAAQVAYQRARRNYMAAEDQVKLDVRSEFRDMRAQRELFEIQRRALRVAARELEQAMEAGEKLQEGPEGGRQQGLNIPRALENIVDAQDELIEAWVDYESARLELFRDMGVMQVDETGVWSEGNQALWSTPPDGTPLP